MNRNKHMIAVMLTAGILGAGCATEKNEQNAQGQENYRDRLFVAMLNDSSLVQEEQALIDSGEVAFYAHFEQPLLWEEGGDTTLRCMADFYNYLYDYNAIATDVDTWYRYDEDEKMKEELLDAWRKITFKGISDNWVVGRMKEARDVDTEGKEDRTASDLSDVYRRLSWWAPEADSVYYTDTIEASISPRVFLPEGLRGRYDDYVGQEASPSDTMVAELYEMYRKEEDFDRRMGMLFTLFGSTVYSRSDTTTMLLKDAEEAFTSGNYSPMMPLVWRAYRVVYTERYSCPSTYCERTNVRFNYYKRLIAYTFLRHIERHRDDKIAIIQYACLAEQGNIDRFGEYMLGHQGAAELIYIFWFGGVL